MDNNRIDELLTLVADGLSAILSSENVRVVVLVVDQSTYVREGDIKIVQHRGKHNQVRVSKLGAAR